MNFLVVLVAMLIERFFDWSHVRDWSWFWPYIRTIQKKLGQSPIATIAIAIIPVMVGVWLVDYLLQGWLYGFLTLVFNIFLLIYCLGPQNLWADTFSSITTLREGDIQFGAEKLNLAFNAVAVGDTQSQHHTLLNAIFVAADRRVFAVIFWFVALGPMGAVLYRMSAVPLDTNLKKHTEFPQLEVLERNLQVLESVLNWVPARLFTLLFALGGHFMQVFNVWRRLAWKGLTSNDELITECGWAALGKSQQDILPLEGTTERSAVNLLDRVFVIAIIIIAAIDWIVR